MADIIFDGYFNSLRNKPTSLAGYGIVNGFDGTWASIIGRPELATVATTGNYNNLIDKPDLNFIVYWSNIQDTPTTLAGYGITDGGSGSTGGSFMTAADILAKLLTVDGAGSLLDSDLLDGQHGSYYQPLHASLTSIAGLTEAAGTLIYGTADNAYAVLAAGALTQLLVGGGAAAPVWTEASGTGAPIRAGSPTFTTQITSPLIYGSAVADGDITIRGTVHATKTTSYVILQDTGGNVGIGTTTPGAKLDIYSAAGSVPLIINSAAAGSVLSGMYIQQGGTETAKYITDGNSGQIQFGSSHASYYLSIYSGGAEKIRINTAGNVGIGFTIPLSALCINGGLHVGGESAAGDNNLWVDGTVQEPNFSTGFAGSNWQITAAGVAEFEELRVRGTLHAYELEINKITSINGGMLVTVANAVSTTFAGTTIYFDEGEGLTIPFIVNDFIKAQQLTGTGIAAYVGQVTAVNAGNVVATTISGTPYNNMDLVQFGHTTTAARQNAIYITASETNNPYIAGYTGLNNGAFNAEKFRLGNLTGAPAGSGVGLYCDNVFLTGNITATSGAIGGFTIGATTLLAGADATRIEFNTAVGIHMGATAFASAPFSVTRAGVLKAISGTIGGFAIGDTYIRDAAGVVGISSAVTGGDDIRFWAGHATMASAPFRVTEAGVVTATLTNSTFQSVPVPVGDLSGSVVNTQANVTAVARVDRIDLTGASGSAIVVCNAISRLMTFSTNLEITADNFVTAHAAAYTASGVTVEAFGTGTDVYLKFTANVAGTNFTGATSITNDSDPDLAGTVSTIVANRAAVKQIDTITLTGTSGTANILCDAVTKLASFFNSLTDTAAGFVIEWAASYLPGGVVVTSSGADVIFTSDTAGIAFTGATTITNVANAYRGGLKIEGNEIWENVENNDLYGFITINRKGLNGGITRYRHLSIYNGKGKTMAQFQGSGDNGVISLRTEWIGVPNIPTTNPGGGASKYLWIDANGFVKIGS